MRYYLSKIFAKGYWRWIVLDIFMLILLLLNITWYIVDVSVMQYCKSVLGSYTPSFSSIYPNVYHPVFLVFDGIAVTIFFWEFFFRWGWAVWHKTYRKWFLYPVFHWYDLLGSVPGSTLRFLRIIRLFGLVYRLHQVKIINAENYYLVRLLLQYYQVLVEEISDRVASKLLRETKIEIQKQPPIAEEIVEKVLLPKTAILSEWIGKRVQSSLKEQYEHNRLFLRSYVEETVQKVMREHKDVVALERMPLIGRSIKETLSEATSQIVFGVTDRLMSDLGNTDNEAVIRNITSQSIEKLLAKKELDEKGIAAMSSSIISEAIDLIIERIQKKR